MRKIIFRGKRVDNGEWIKGFVTQHTICGEETYLATVIEIPPQKIYDVENYVIDSTTIGQFIGLQDKNKCDIFEGDVVKAIVFHDAAFPNGPGYYEEVGQIEYSYGYAGYALSGKKYYGRFGCSDAERSEIIGNIHDNPELLAI